jgi:hypothetical protein
MYKLSVIMPAIRSEKWKGMYDSISESFSGDWELIIITEVPLPAELKDKKNIQVVPSARSPMQKQQQGLSYTRGEFVTVVSDDSLWLPGTLNKTFEFIDSIKDFDYLTFIILKYLEGKEFEFPKWYLDQVPDDMKFRTNWDFMKSDKYYWSDTHKSSEMPGIPIHSPILSCAMFKRKLLLEVGGWDAQFQSQAMGNVDLSARLMYYGCDYYIQDLIVSTCGYMKQDTGDHGPIHYAQIEDDEPLLYGMYSRPRHDRIKIPLDNWKNTPEVWKRKKT